MSHLDLNFTTYKIRTYIMHRAENVYKINVLIKIDAFTGVL